MDRPKTPPVGLVQRCRRTPNTQDIDRIVMGWNQVNEFAELVSDGRLMPIVDVAELRVRGYPVQLVPHFDGILVIPKLKEPT